MPTGWFSAATSIVRSLCGTIIILVSLLAAPAFANSVVYQKLQVKGFPTQLVTVNLNDKSVVVSPSLNQNGRGGSETFASMVKRTKPAAAITGTFFDTRTLLPTGDIVIEGKKVHRGVIGTAICIDSENQAHFVPREKMRQFKSDQFDTVLGAGPTLLREGKWALDPKAEGFKDPALFKRANRVAVGVTANNKLLLVVIPRNILLSELAKIMQALGATDAVALDGGSSSGIYADNRIISAPKRKLTNTLMVFVGNKQYSSARAQLAPTHITTETTTPRQERLERTAANQLAQR